jgi:hypothetical protein
MRALHVIANLSTNINHKNKRFSDTGTAVSTNNLHFRIQVPTGGSANDVKDAIDLYLRNEADMTEAGYDTIDFKTMVIT